MSPLYLHKAQRAVDLAEQECPHWNLESNGDTHSCCEDLRQARASLSKIRKTYQESESLWEGFKKGQLSHLEFRKKHDDLEAQFNHDLAKARGQSRYWDPLVNDWRET